MPFDIAFSMKLHGILSTIGPLDVADILIVAAILYKIYEMLQDTRAITLVNRDGHLQLAQPPRNFLVTAKIGVGIGRRASDCFSAGTSARARASRARQILQQKCRA